MKSILVVCCLFALAKADLSAAEENMDEILADHIKSCAEELEIASVETDKFHDTELQGEERTKFGCLKACVLKRMKSLEDGKIKPEGFQEMLEKMYADKPEVIASKMEMVRQCTEEVKEKVEECDLAFELSRCLMIKDKE